MLTKGAENLFDFGAGDVARSVFVEDFEAFDVIFLDAEVGDILLRLLQDWTEIRELDTRFACVEEPSHCDLSDRTPY